MPAPTPTAASAPPRSAIPRTKIVCTLGPASSSADMLRQLIDAGLNVARINFSHGTHEEHARTIARIRAISGEMGRAIAILGDLQGPRIRIGDLAAPVHLGEGVDVTMVPEDVARPGELPVTYEALARDVHVGDRILIDDGLLELIVLDVDAPRVHARVVHGGEVKSHKGMNLPGIHVSAPSITEKDKADARFAADQGVDFLALSFVRRSEDIGALKAMIPKELMVIAKIEKDVALRNIESIVHAADGVMVARGDLGVELPFEEVPIAQKQIIALANRMGRPVITATQMLESMVEHPRPTRAEASDVANAILDGTDAVMLSAETATGAFPRLAVEAMRRIIVEMESHAMPHRTRDDRRHLDVVSTEEAIAAATAAAVSMLAAPLVVVFTQSGFTARIVAAHRPGVPILALTDEARTYRQLALVWGVLPDLAPRCPTYEDMIRVALESAVRRGLAASGDRVVVTTGIPNERGTTNLLKVATV